MDYKKLADEIILWIKNWFKDTNAQGPAVIGISGGKDSTIVAKLCLEALGEDNVIGVSMPGDGQDDKDAKAVAEAIGLKHLITVPIRRGVRCVANNCFASCAMVGMFNDKGIEGSDELKKFLSRSEQNLPPRIRMATLYYISQLFNGRVANTCNLSEDWLGYSSIYGDAAGDFGPLESLTVTEIRGVGDALGIPRKWVWKIPDDGLPNSAPDEEKFGFSYEVLDKYIRTGECEDPEVKAKIDRMHEASQFKRDLLHIPAYNLWSGKVDEDLEFS